MSRRAFVAASAGAAAGTWLGGLVVPGTAAYGATRGSGRIRVGVIGCGGRGTGAAVDILRASGETEIVALGDVMAERVEGCASNLAKQEPGIAERAKVPMEARFSGFEAWEGVLAARPEVVILATPPHFRPMHFEGAVKAGCHVFMEKPVAVDPAGVRRVLEAGRLAREKRLSVAAGTQRRHERCYREAVSRVRDGAIGRAVAARVYWNQGGLWMHPRQAGWSDMEWQLRNWLYFTWLSGDHIVEQHVHNLDAACWVLGTTPTRCSGMGGRQARTGPEYGHVYDHFAVDYEHPDGVTVQSYCRQIDGCHGRVEEVVSGTEGTLVTTSGRAEIRDRSGKVAWRFEGENPNPYVEEHRHLVESITGAGAYLNEAEQVAHSTLSAIMGRMSAYTGKQVTWEKALASSLDLTPTGGYAMGPMPPGEVAVPGRTPLV